MPQITTRDGTEIHGKDGGTGLASAPNGRGGGDVTATRELAPDLGSAAAMEVTGALRRLLADVFALYVKTKSFHWHISGPHFRDYHLLLDEQASQIFEMTDAIAERARKMGGTTLRSISDISRHQRLRDNNEDGAGATAMLTELRDDNRHLTRLLQDVHELCDRHGDVATASLTEKWIDEAQQRAWFLSETTRDR